MSATTAVEMPEIGATGLTSKEVVQRIESGQSNAVKTSTSRSVRDIVRANVFTLFNGIIFAAMVLVLITGSWRDAVFGFVIIINTGIGIVTELRAKRTLDKLSILVASEFLVRRDGKDVGGTSQRNRARRPAVDSCRRTGAGRRADHPDLGTGA